MSYVLNSTQNAVPVDTVTYDAFGRMTAGNTSYLGRIGYDGYVFDGPSVLYIAGARAYDPVGQRWLEQDPIGFKAGDPNLYRYVHNMPTNAADPSGLAEDDQPGFSGTKSGRGRKPYLLSPLQRHSYIEPSQIPTEL